MSSGQCGEMIRPSFETAAADIHSLPIAFLMSDIAWRITGATVFIDGELTIVAMSSTLAYSLFTQLPFAQRLFNDGRSHQ